MPKRITPADTTTIRVVVVTMRLATELWAGTIEPLPGKSLKDREIFDLLGFD